MGLESDVNECSSLHQPTLGALAGPQCAPPTGSLSFALYTPPTVVSFQWALRLRGRRKGEGRIYSDATARVQILTPSSCAILGKLLTLWE